MMGRSIALPALLLADLSFPADARLVTDSAGRRVEIPERITRVFAAGPPASVVLYVLAPEKMIGWVPGAAREREALPSAGASSAAMRSAPGLRLWGAAGSIRRRREGRAAVGLRKQLRTVSGLTASGRRKSFRRSPAAAPGRFPGIPVDRPGRAFRRQMTLKAFTR